MVEYSEKYWGVIYVSWYILTVNNVGGGGGGVNLIKMFLYGLLYSTNNIICGEIFHIVCQWCV